MCMLESTKSSSSSSSHSAWKRRVAPVPRNWTSASRAWARILQNTLCFAFEIYFHLWQGKEVHIVQNPPGLELQQGTHRLPSGWESIWSRAPQESPWPWRCKMYISTDNCAPPPSVQYWEGIGKTIQEPSEEDNVVEAHAIRLAEYFLDTFWARPENPLLHACYLEMVSVARDDSAPEAHIHPALTSGCSHLCVFILNLRSPSLRSGPSNPSECVYFHLCGKVLRWSGGGQGIERHVDLNNQ